MIVVDCETTKQGDLVLIGLYGDINNKIEYYPFSNADTFFDFIKSYKIKEIFCHNVEFDFFKIYENKKSIKFSAYMIGGQSSKVAYVQQGNIVWKDVLNHLPYSLELLGKIIKLEKLKIDYDKIDVINNELLVYNKRDCEITYLVLQKVKEIYTLQGLNKIPATVGSASMKILLLRFYGSKFLKIDEDDLKTWRKSYTGGWVECFKSGKFNNDNYYKIDINSLFPAMMRTSLPDYKYYRKVNELTQFEYQHKYWLGYIYNEQYDNYDCVNSIENRDKFITKDNCNFYYVFDYKIYPFRKFVKYFYNLKDKSIGLAREIYKLILNSCYGKFAQRSELDVISNYNYKETKDLFYKENIKDDLYRCKFNKPNKYWVNVIWSSFITAKAREYMSNLFRYIKRRNIEIYYIDTDCFIISGDIKEIANIISNDKIGLFKLEDMANSIEIKGKKMYKFGEMYKCKGIPAQYRKEFFENDKIVIKKMVRYKEALRRGIKLGSWIEMSKRNKVNLYQTCKLAIDN